MQHLKYFLLIVTATVLGFLASGLGWMIHLLQNSQPADVYVSEQATPSTVIVDAKKVVGLTKPGWQQFAQGGEEPGGEMLHKTVSKMSQIKPGYIRLDHIFDDDYYGVVSPDGTYDFTKLDKTVADILQMGAKPFFSLGYMPKSVADTKISEPQNWQSWQNLVQALILHYSGRSGKNISDIYYEVWNEPDLESFGSWHYGGDKNYLTLYSYTAGVANSLRKRSDVNNFKIGGPAITALYRNWVMALVRFADQRSLPLDFISWHRYSYYPQSFADDYNNIEVWRSDLEKELGHSLPFETIISEWGPDSEKTPIYNANFSAAHAVAVISQSLKIDGLYAFEVKDGPQQGNQGWGIFDFAGQKYKPRYMAFNYLTDMSGRQLNISGLENSQIYGWAVNNFGQDLKIILSNYQTSNAQEVKFPLVLKNLDPGQYLLNWESLQGDQGEKLFDVGDSGRLNVNLAIFPYDVMKLTLKNIHPLVKNSSPKVNNSQKVDNSLKVNDSLKLSKPIKVNDSVKLNKPIKVNNSQPTTPPSDLGNPSFNTVSTSALKKLLEY